MPRNQAKQIDVNGGRLVRVNGARASVLAAAFLAIASPAMAQVLSTQVLGSITLVGPKGPGIVISPRGDQLARRERVGTSERYVTLKGPGETFDRILPGALWIDDRLVYYAVKGQQTLIVDGAKRIPIKGTPTSAQVLGRFLPSADHQHYLAFVSDGKSIGWYFDGKPRTSRFDRLAFVEVVAPKATPVFVGVKACKLAVVGHGSSASARWDMLHWVNATEDGSVAYVYGELAGRALLHRNGVEIFRERIDKFATSRDGKTWMAAVDRSADGNDRTELLKDGAVVAQADVDVNRQRMWISGDGSTWAWSILDDDYIGSTLRRPGMADRRFATDPLEYHLSGDGRREAFLLQSADSPGRTVVQVDGKPGTSVAGVRANSFQFGTGAAFAFVVIDGGTQYVVSHLGEGTKYDEVSSVLLLPDGRPAYVAATSAEKFIVVGNTAIKVAADNIHHLATLRLQGTTVRVLGDRGDEIVDFSVNTN